MTNPKLETIIENIVRNDILTNCSCMILELSGNNQYIDEIMNFSVMYVNNDDSISELNDQIEDLEIEQEAELEEMEDFIDAHFDFADSTLDFQSNYERAIAYAYKQEIQAIQWEIDDLQNEMDDPTEALEFWIVTNWLADKLEKQGELITNDFMGFNIWGRTTSGQAISMDYVMEKIAKTVAIA